VTGGPPAAQLFAGLLSCLPPECRPEFSFSTGLKFSSRRPFRLVALSGDRAEQRWVARHNNVSVLDLADGAPLRSRPIDGWARLVGRVSALGKTAFLAAQLSKRRSELTLADLPALGLQLLEELDAAGFPAERAHAAHQRFAKTVDAATAAKLAAAAPSQCLDTSSPAVLDKLEYLDDVVY
jgi:hypothetical protein